MSQGTPKHVDGAPPSTPLAQTEHLDDTPSSLTLEPNPPARVGDYEVVGVLGRGGMGSVYLAERDQAGVRRKVAVKVLSRGLDSTEIRRRFRVEGQVLARLDHPNIARLIEAGEADTGEAFLAMEYVAGQPLTRFCDSHRCSVRARIELFVKVCDALAMAHRNLVVHRDIKPSNILVTSEGEPKLLDFGIAKPLEALADDESIFETGPHALLMTPHYASPEQVLGGPISVATDVYSAGVVLFELLTGLSPYLHAGEVRPGGPKLLQAITEARISAPSTLVARLARAGDTGEGARAAGGNAVRRLAWERGESRPERLRARLVGDLDNILLKALQLDPARRYPSVTALAEDLQRHLTGEPVQARPATVAYRAHRMLRRHPWPLAAVASVVLFSATLAVVLGLHARTVAAERDRVEAALAREADAREQAEQARAQIAEVAQFQARQLAEIDVVAMGAGLEAGLRAQLGDATGAPESDGWLAGVNFTDLALDALETNVFGRTLERVDAELADQPLVQSYLWFSIAKALEGLGRAQAALAPMERALATRTRALGRDHPDTLVAVNGLAVVLATLGRYSEAEGYHREALERRRAALGDDHPDTLKSLNDLAFAIKAQGRLAEAEPIYREALARQRAVHGDAHPNTQRLIANLASLLESAGRLDEAEPLHREGLALSRRHLGAEHPETLTSLNNLGSVLHERDHYAEAERLYRESLRLSRKILGNGHPETIVSINNLGAVLNDLDRLDEAEALYREALSTARRVLGPDHRFTLVALHNNAGLLRRLGRLDEAHALISEAINRARGRLGADHLYVGVFLSNQGRILHGLGRYAEAEAAFLEAHAILSPPGRGGEPFVERPIAGLVALYGAWHAREPEAGFAARQAQWQARQAARVAAE